MHMRSPRQVLCYKTSIKALKLPPDAPTLLPPHESLLSSCSPPSLWGHQTLRQFVLNLTTQMFLWVTDFYSLEEIISAFPEIVLLALRKKKVRRLEGSLQLGWWKKGFCTVWSLNPRLPLGLRSGWMGAPQFGGGGVEIRGSRVETKRSRVWLIALDTDSFSFQRITPTLNLRILVFDRQLGWKHTVNGWVGRTRVLLFTQNTSSLSSSLA